MLPVDVGCGTCACMRCWVRAICALRLKWKPRPLLRPRGVRPPRLPRMLEASELLVRSSLLDTMFRVVGVFWGDLAELSIGLTQMFL